MESNAKLETLLAILQAGWFQGLLWVCGGCLWMASILQWGNSHSPLKVPSRLQLQGTVIDDQRRIAVISGGRFAVGQKLVTNEGIFQVQAIEPGRAILRRGHHLLPLELSALGEFPMTSSPFPVSLR